MGDCEEKYTSVGVRNIIDHLDMDHENVSNLQLVSMELIFRAITKEIMKKSFIIVLILIGKLILKELDLQGKY